MKRTDKYEHFERFFQMILCTFYQVRAGSHENIPMREIDKSAFSFSKQTDRPSPTKFVKAKSGNGGMMTAKSPASPESKSPTRLEKKPKTLTHPAFATRLNPPNTELRRCVHNCLMSQILFIVY